jgi:hypothetical protein
MKTNDKIVGGFAVLSFPELGVKRTIAKIDTGAYSGALHATNMREVKTNKGNYVLKFHPMAKKELEARAKNYQKKRVRSSNGHLEERYIIQTIVEVDGQEYPITISLSDRSNMMKEVLIGREFLRRHGFLVDVRRGTKYRYAKKV